MKKFWQNQNVKLIAFAGIVLAIVINLNAVGKGIAAVLNILYPVFLGCFMAYLLNILVRPIENKWLSKHFDDKHLYLKRGISITLSLASIIILMGLLMKLVIPQFVDSMTVFVRRLPEMIDKIQVLSVKYMDLLPGKDGKAFIDNLSADSVLKSLEKISRHLISSGGDTIKSVFGFGFSLIMGIILAVYIVASKEMLGRQAREFSERYFKADTKKKWAYVISVFDDSLHSFIVGQTIEACILGTLCGVGLFVLRFPYAAMIGTVVGVTALVPLLGAYIGGAFGFLMIFTVDPLQAVFFLVFLVLLQWFEDNVIYPKVVGTSVGLPGVWIFAVIIIGGGLSGVAGVFFSVPIAAAIYKLISNSVHKVSEEEYINSKKENGLVAKLRKNHQQS